MQRGLVTVFVVTYRSIAVDVETTLLIFDLFLTRRGLWPSAAQFRPIPSLYGSRMEVHLLQGLARSLFNPSNATAGDGSVIAPSLHDSTTSHEHVWPLKTENCWTINA